MIRGTFSPNLFSNEPRDDKSMLVARWVRRLVLGKPQKLGLRTGAPTQYLRIATKCTWSRFTSQNRWDISHASFNATGSMEVSSMQDSSNASFIIDRREASRYSGILRPRVQSFRDPTTYSTVCGTRGVGHRTIALT